MEAGACSTGTPRGSTGHGYKPLWPPEGKGGRYRWGRGGRFRQICLNQDQSVRHQRGGRRRRLWPYSSPSFFLQDG